MSIQLEHILSASDPASLTFDSVTGQCVALPENLDLSTTQSQAQPATASFPFLKMVPRLNPEKTHITPAGLEIISSQFNVLSFISEQSFESGSHSFELSHLMGFKNVKVGICRERKNGSRQEYVVNLDKAKNSTSVILKLDLEQRKLSLILKHINYKREIKFKGTGYHFFITLGNIGNFIALNPFYLNKGVSTVWKFHTSLLETKNCRLMSDWRFFTEFKPEAHGSLETFLATEIKVNENQTHKIKTSVFDPDLSILAIEIDRQAFKALKTANKDLKFATKAKVSEAISLTFKEGSVATNDGAQKLADFIHRHKTQLIKTNQHEQLTEFLPKLKQLSPKLIKKSSESRQHGLGVNYLSEPDVLLLSNGHNKLKVLKQRSPCGSFVVSPFVFATDRVSTILTWQEFQIIFHRLNWEDLLQRLALDAEEISSLHQLFQELTHEDNLARDESHVFLSLSPQSQQILVEKAFEYANILLRQTENAVDKEDELITETLNEENPDEDAHQTTVVEEDPGLGELFHEPGENQLKMTLRKSSLKQKVQTFFKNHFDIFPTEFNGLLKVLHRLEEAFYLQSQDYRKRFVAVARPHCSLNRLCSYLYSGLELSSIERLADCGLYISSTFLQEFRHYAHEEHAYGDFNDYNTAPLLLKAYGEFGVNPNFDITPTHNIELDFSISHLPPLILNEPIERVFLPTGGKLVLVLTTDKVLHIFSARFGLTKLGELKLTDPVSWAQKALFESIIPATTEGNEYFTQDNLSDLKKKEEEAKVPKPVEAENPDLVNKLMLDQLYQMGFSIELAKKALVEVKSASLDAALTIIFQLNEKESKPAEKAQTKTFQLLLKPEWQCKICTFFNTIETIPDAPNKCEMCGNIADEDAYFEETQEIIEEPMAPNKITGEASAGRTVLSLSDEVLDVALVQLERENLLHHLFICLLVRSEDKKTVLVSRLAFSEPFLHQSVVIDPKNGNFLSIFGQHLLKKGRKEKDLGELIQNFYIDKILNIAPRLSGNAIFVESAREELLIEGLQGARQIMASVDAQANERNSEIHALLVAGDQAVQQLILTNKAKTYGQVEFELSKTLTKTFDGFATLLQHKNGVIVVSAKGIDLIKGQLDGMTSLFTSTEGPIEIISQPHACKLPLKISEKLHLLDLDDLAGKVTPKQLAFYIESQALHGKANQFTDLVNPKVMLSYFKAQTNLIFDINEYENLYPLSTGKKSGLYEYFLQTIDSQASSKLTIQTKHTTQGLNLNIEAYYQVAKGKESVNKFIAASQTVKDRQLTNYHVNNYYALQLKAVAFKGAHFSKNYYLSQMLLNNGEHFSTQYANNLFLFENVFERTMKIKQFVFTIPESFKQNSTVEKVLVFVFDDLALANIFSRYKHLTFEQYQNALTAGTFPRRAEPCLCINLKQQTEGAEIKAELDIERVGRFVAFLPLVSSKSTPHPNNQVFDCFQYFGVEGEYLSQEEEADHWQAFSNDPIEAGQQALPFEPLTWQIQHNGDRHTEVKDFTLQNVLERRGDVITKVLASSAIAGEALNRLDISIPGAQDGLQLIGFSVRLLNISNNLSIEVREQFKHGASEKFKHFLSVYNEQIIERKTGEAGQIGGSATTDLRASESLSAQELEIELVALGELLAFSLDTFGSNAAECIVQTLNLKTLIQKTILAGPSAKVLSLYRLLVEKLIGHKVTHEALLETLCTLLDTLTANILAVEGVSALWQSLHKLSTRAETRIATKITEAVSNHLHKSLNKVKDNNDDCVKLLRTFDFAETIDGTLTFRSGELTADKQTGSESTSLKLKGQASGDFADPQKLINYSGFCLQDRNYTEIYINCREIMLVDSLMFRFRGVTKLFDYCLEVQYYCHYTNRFYLVKSKRLNEDFMNYVVSSAKREGEKRQLDEFDFGLNFGHINYPVKLLRLILKANHLPIFEYREPEVVALETYVFGRNVSDMIKDLPVAPADEKTPTAVEKCLSEFVGATNIFYASTFDEFQLNNNLKPKIVELDSAELYKNLLPTGSKTELVVEPKTESNATQQTPIELLGIFEDIQNQRETLGEYLRGLTLLDTKNLNKIKSHIANFVTNYNKNLETLEQDRRARTLSSLQYDHNLSFWICNIDFALKEFFVNSQGGFALLLKDLLSDDKRVDLIFMLFYEVYLLDNSKYGKIEDIIGDLSSALSEAQSERLVGLIAAKFLKEAPIVFARNCERLIDKLRSTKLLGVFNWRKVLRLLEQDLTGQFDRNKTDEAIFRQIVLYSQILLARLSEEKTVTAEDFKPMLGMLVWMLNNGLPGVTKRFRETATLLLTRIFKLLEPTPEAEANVTPAVIEGEIDINTSTLQLLLVLLLQNDMIPEIDKALSDFQKTFSTKGKTAVLSEQNQKMPEKLLRTLMALVREEIIEKEDGPLSRNGKFQAILFFALTHIKSINDLLYHNLKKAEEKTAIGLVKMPSKKESMKKKDSIVKKDTLSITASNLPASSPVKDGDNTFNDFVADILAFIHRKQIKDNTVVSTITNFAISEQINQAALFSFMRFAMSQAPELRQTIISDLSSRFTDIFKLIKSWNNKLQLRDFATLSIELLIFIMSNYPNELVDDVPLVHFCVKLAVQVINENEAKTIADEPCKIALKSQIVLPLFSEAFKLMTEHFNFGGVENFQFFGQDKLNLFELVVYCVHILVKGIDEAGAPLLNYLIQNFKSLRETGGEQGLSAAVQNLCVWLLCNVSSAAPDLKSIVGPLFKKLYTDVDFLYFELMKKEECAKLLLTYTCQHFRALYKTLYRKLKGESLGYLALYLAENSIDFMENLLKHVAKNEILSAFFLNQIKGLEMIFGILTEILNNETLPGPALTESAPNSLLAALQAINQSGASSTLNLDTGKAIHSVLKDKAIFDEEYGNRIKNIYTDKTLTNGSNTKDWHANKAGRNPSIYSTSIALNRKSISLRFKSSEAFELRNFKLSLTVTRSENYIVVGPSPYVHMYAIIEDEQKPGGPGRRVYLGELERLEDSGYLLFNAVVYVLNPNRLTGPDYLSALDNIKYVREITDFEIVIARPLFTVVDKISPLCGKAMTALNVSINFISIDGFSHSRVDLLASFRAKTQTTLNNLIDTIFNSENFVNPLDEYFDALNRQGNTELYALIESQLDPIMQNFNEKMSRFLMILSEKNKHMADSIFVFLMKNIQKKLLFFDLIEKILKRTHSYKYLFEFFEFGRKKLCGSADEAVQFLKVVTNYLAHLTGKLEEEGVPGGLVLPIDLKFFKVIMNFHRVKPFTFSIERFLVITIGLLYNRKLFTEFPTEIARLSSYQLGRFALNQNNRELAISWISCLVQAVEQGELIFLPILAYIAVECEEAKKQIIEHDFIGLALRSVLKEGKTLRTEVLLFIGAIAEFGDLYEFAIAQKADQTLLTTLEAQLQNAEFKTDEDQIHLLLKTIFKVFRVSRERVLELEETLFKLLKDHKSEPFFIEKVFLKFFEFEMTKAVCFKVVKRTAPEADEAKLESEVINSNLAFGQKRINLQSSLATADTINKLAGRLVHVVDEKTEKEIRRHEWRKVVETSDSNEDFGAKLEATCFGKKPLMILANTDWNGLAGTLGLFAPEGFIECTDQTDYNAYIPNSDNVFLFYYTEGTELHYKPDLEFCPKFLQYSSNPDNKTVSLLYDMSEKVLISMMPDVPSNIDLSPMKPILQDNNQEFEFPYDVHINCIEIFQLDIKSDTKSQRGELEEAEDLCFKYLNRQSIVNLPRSLYNSSVVYDLQNELSVRALKEVALLIGPLAEDRERRLADLFGQYLTLEVSREVPPLSRKLFENNYNPKFPIFEAFIERGGMKYVIETIKQNDKITYLSQNNLAEVWRRLMDDLLDLEQIEGFLSSMIQNKEFLLILFELFTGAAKSERNWQEAEFSVSSLVFEKLASILKNTDSADTRRIFFKKNVLRKLLDKLSFLTSENPRVFNDEPDKPEVAPESQVAPKEESLIKEVKKRKGVGYDKEGSGKKWLVNEYLAKKKQKNEFVVHLLKLLKNLFSVNYEDPASPLAADAEFHLIKESWFNTIAESSLLPLFESAFKSSSLHEMAKEYEVYEQYCQVLLTLSDVPQLKPLLKQLPNTYKPVQLESLLSILLKQDENTRLFKKFSQVENAKPKEGEEKLHSIELANLIQETIEVVKNRYPEFLEDLEDGYEEISDEAVQRIQQLPVNDQYKTAFKDLKFDLVDMKKVNDAAYDHHYASNVSSDAKVSSQARMVRLAQEIADLTSSLPVDSYNAITVRADSNRLDVIKAMIAGAEGTPYANGLFEYHVYLPNEYPSGPPKCNLETTGSGDVRFNPNLYSCGKVCLSLLGTWRGSASENWDPKISNLLQLFLSIQSVVMSEEVYFNEPGYEGEAGTEEGEKKNEGYSNIVRLCNIKFAMIRHIKTPVKGFEEVTRRHFYIKRDVILNECARWVKMAEVRSCTYSGLVSDHNHKYTSRFTQNAKNYVTDLKAAIADLEVTLKELVLNNNPHHIFAGKRHGHGHGKPKAKRVPKDQGKKEGEVMDLATLREKIDTTWDEGVSNKVFDAEDQTVSDRWSRYIGAMGIEAVKKQSQAKVAIIGLNALGLEIAKNIVLSGVNTLALCDWRELKETDLLGNFYAGAKDIGRNRAEVIKPKLEQLNFYVKVEAIKLTDGPTTAELATRFDLLVICDNFGRFVQPLIQKAHELKKKLIVSETVGVYARVFNDFGKEFIVNDRDGEEPAECYIKSIEPSTNRITLFDKSQNLLRDGDYIVLSEVESPAEDEANSALKPLNGSIQRIKEMHKLTEIEVEDLSGFKGFLRNGKIKELKVPIKHDFAPYSELSLTTLNGFWDENMRTHDFLKYESSELVAKCFLVKEAFELSKNADFSSVDFEEVEKSLSKEVAEDEKLVKKLRLFWLNSRGRVHSLDAFMGGVVSQEAIKSITGKFTPIKQIFCTEFEELLDESLVQAPDTVAEKAKSLPQLTQKFGKYTPLVLLLGEATFEKLKQSRVFMVGSGAIGCELLKNYAMIGLGSGVEHGVTLTDPDSIELSNLNRQFLFREKHIGKPKSIVAASVVEQMNPDFTGRITARLEKVCDETEAVFSDEFITARTMCLNALDNVKARVYMDQRCVRNHVPLLESGTLGPKGHVQVILPKLTENYTQVQDANDEQNIPVCTLKMFPEEPIHCMEWAKDRFEVFFAQNPKSCARVLEEFAKSHSLAEVDPKVQKTVLKFLTRRPTSIKDVIALGLKYYYKAFHNKIRQLLHVYPLDFVTKDGKLFWTLPKRPPVPLTFSPEDELDQRFMRSFVKLQARMWGIEEPFPSPAELATIVSSIEIEPFKPKDSAAENIKQAVEKQAQDPQAQPTEADDANKDPQAAQKKHEEDQETSKALEALLSATDVDKLLKTIKIEVFEKDNDQNGHVDFIHALTNHRTRNYKLPTMEWIQVKLKAGRIVPALATTTSAIAGLQTIEAIKVVKALPIEQFRSAFLNLAIPSMTLSEPGAAAKFKIHDELEVSVWNQWEYSFTEKEGNTLKALFEHLQATYKIIPCDLLKGNKPIFFSAIDKFEDFQNRNLDDLLELDQGEYCYANIICKLKPEDDKSLQNIPQLRIKFN